MAKNKKVEISLEEKLEKALVPVDHIKYLIIGCGLGWGK